VHDADLEGVAVEPEMALDAAQEPLDPGVGPDGAPSPSGPVGADQPRGESLLVGAAHRLLEGAPVGALDPLE